jgi:hypothetical protein
MREFAQLAGEANPRFPMAAELWTCHHLATHPYARCDLDWGVCLAFHFDRGVPLGSWLRLVNTVRNRVEHQSELREIIRFVPFYEVGADFFTQCKPPYDGGYPTTRYEEFLYHGDCEPAPWFYQQLATLLQRVAETNRSLPDDPTGRLLRKIIHATLIRTYLYLFCQDDDGWAVYQPNISTTDVQAWTSMSQQ